MRSENIEYNEDIEYDKLKFKEFLTGCNLNKLLGESVVLVLGLMGAGKSTGIAIQLGATYKKNPTDRGYLLEKADTYTPVTSDGYTSQTLNVGSYKDLVSQLIYLDTAGLNDNRGKEEDLWTKSNLDVLFSIVKEIKSVIVFFDYTAAFGTRGENFRDLADEILKVTMGAEIFYQSMVFVVTNGYDGTRRISINNLVADAARMLQEVKDKEREYIADLERRYPLGTARRVAAAGRAIMGALDATSEEVIRFDIVMCQQFSGQKVINNFLPFHSRLATYNY